MLPVCGCLAIDCVATSRNHDRVFPPWTLWVIGLFGILPDVCSPHITLEDRHASFSHSVWFMAGLSLALPMAAVFLQREYRWQVATACWIAAALHLVADAISGGIAWLHPWKPDVIGAYHIPPEDWIWHDGGFIILAWLLLRTVPVLEGRSIRRNHRREIADS